MPLRLAGEEFSVVRGLDGLGWLREIQAGDSRPGLKITQSGLGPALDVNRNVVHSGGYGPVVEAGASDFNLGWSGSALWLVTRSSSAIKLGVNGLEKASLGTDGFFRSDAGFRTANLMLKEGDANTWTVRDTADAAFKAIKVKDLFFHDYLDAQTTTARMRTVNADNASLSLYARDNGVDLAEVARLQSGAEPRLKFTLPAQMVRDAGDYGGGFGSYNAGAGVEGDMKVAEDINSGTPGRRIYIYSGGAWRYAALS